MLRPASRGRVQGRDPSGFYSRSSYEQGATMQCRVIPRSAVLAILWVLRELLVSKLYLIFFQFPFLIFECVEDD